MKYYLLTPALLLAACGGNITETKPVDTQKKVKVEPPKPVPVDQDLSRFAKFIAGVDVGNSYAQTNAEAWKTFASSNTEKWNALSKKIGDPISAWVDSAGLERKGEPKTLFYPFAGGDFYYAHEFFPEQDTIIMLGLEPGGSIFTPDTVSSKTYTAYYGQLQHTMYFPHRLGFFRTKSMKDDFDHSLLNGTLHTVLFYLARFSYDINYIEHFNLNDDGSEKDLTQGKDAIGKKRFTAYRVGYSRNGGSVKQVVYFSYDASNANLAAKPGLMNWLNKRHSFNAYFKAASYLMHYSIFSTMRDFVHKKVFRILQDDSGMPYKFLKENNYEIKLLGKYTRNIPLFKDEFQPALKEAYKNAAPKPLPFLIGYNSEFGECNLQAAYKK